jgi:flagellar motor switch protein FliM
MTEHGDILQRKLAAARPAGPVADPDRALGQGLARMIRDRMGVMVAVEAVTRRSLSLAEVIEEIAEHALLHLVEVQGNSLGAIWLDGALRAGVIEMQTLGHVGRGDVVPRRPTRLDAALCEGFLSVAALALAPALAGGQARGEVSLSSFLDDLRPLPLILDDAPHELVTLQISVGEGQVRRGWISLALPARPAPRAAGDCPDRTAEDGGAEAREEGSWSQRLQRGVLGACAELDAVLCRVSLPLSQVMALEPGVVLGLPGAALDGLDLVDAQGARVAGGKLGQARGNRAVRLTQLATAEATEPSSRDDGATGMTVLSVGVADAVPAGAGAP